MRGLADEWQNRVGLQPHPHRGQQVADTVTIIGRGRLLAEGVVDEILDAGGGQSARVGVAEAPRRQPAHPAGFTVSPLPDGLLGVAATGILDLARITRVLAERGCTCPS